MENEIKTSVDAAQPEEAVQTTEENTVAETAHTELDELKAQLALEQDQYQRVVAEYANYKRRTDQEKEQLGSFVKGEVLKTLLPSIDNLERAIAAPDGDDYRKGVNMVIAQFEESLKAMGLEEIPALGETLTPKCITP